MVGYRREELMTRLRRSTMLVPGNVPEFIEKSRTLNADVLLFDLQDAIAPLDRAKDEARNMVVTALQAGGFGAREWSVRVNSSGSPWIAADIQAVVAAGAHSITLSRCFGAADVADAEAAVGAALLAAGVDRKVDIILEVDTPAMVAELEAMARTTTRVTGLAIAPGDLALEMGVPLYGPDRASGEEWLSYARSKLVTVARWKGWNACDLVQPDPKDLDAVRAAMRGARGRGFDGVATVFPRHVAIANEVFGVSAQELAWAEGVVHGWLEQDDGPNWNKSFRIIDGAMIFAPTLEYARRVLQRHALISGAVSD